MIFKKYPQILFLSSQVKDGNMSYLLGDPNQAQKNRLKFFSKFNIPPHQVAEVKQVHGNKVLKVAKLSKKIFTADGLITNQKSLFLVLKTADCMPIAIFDPKNQVISLIHSGFKGLENKILLKAITLFKKDFHSNPKNLIVQIGPSIGPCCYQMDLWSEAENQLVNLGILKENIDNSPLCTYHNKQFYSHRQVVQEGLPNDYRSISVLGIKNE